MRAPTKRSRTIDLLQQPDGFFAHFFLERTGQHLRARLGSGPGVGAARPARRHRAVPESHPHAREIRAAFVRLADALVAYAGARRPLADADRRPHQLPRDVDGLLRGCGPGAWPRPRPARCVGRAWRRRPPGMRASPSVGRRRRDDRSVRRALGVDRAVALCRCAGGLPGAMGSRSVPGRGARAPRALRSLGDVTGERLPTRGGDPGG